MKTEVRDTFEFIAVSMTAMCFAWGICGLVIGGEKGALLPGAFMGVMCAWFTGSAAALENAFLFAAAGAIGFSFGGMEPYAETMDLVLDRSARPYKPAKGYLGLALKGFLWGGIGAAVLGASFSAASGAFYRRLDIVIFCAQIPIAQELGYRIFNAPYAPEKGIRPKICFSVDSREEWGRNLVVLAELIALMAARGDVFGLIMASGGAISGAVGWIIGIFLYDAERRPLKNGKRIFGKLERFGVIDGWKMMELTLGAVIGLGVSIAFKLGWPLISDKFAAAASAGPPSAPPRSAAAVLPWISCGLIVLSTLLFIIPWVKNGKKITTAFGEVDMHVVDILERPVYETLPLALVLLGSIETARIMCFFVMYFVLAQHDGLERFWDFKNIRLIRTIMILVGALILIGEIIAGYTLWQTWILYCTAYLLFDFIYTFRPRSVKNNFAKSKNFGELVASFGVVATTYPFFILLIVVLLVFGANNLR